jgi:hypothetical protein
LIARHVSIAGRRAGRPGVPGRGRRPGRAAVVAGVPAAAEASTALLVVGGS